MSEKDDSLIDCGKPELEEPYTSARLKTPGTLPAVLSIVIAFLALVATCGRF